MRLKINTKILLDVVNKNYSESLKSHMYPYTINQIHAPGRSGYSYCIKRGKEGWSFANPEGNVQFGASAPVSR